MTDPLKLFSEITCEKIFSYLSVADLLNCSLVNKNYYEFIAKTPSFMRRLKISLTLHNTLLSDDFQNLSILNESQRQYQHFESFNLSIDFNSVYVLRKKLKSIKMRRVLLHDESELKIFFSGIEETIEELILERYIDNLELKVSDNPAISCSFPKLKHLELHYIPNFIFKYFTTCKNLTELKITGKRDVNFYNILRHNPQLKKLAIVTDEIDNYFDEDVTKFIQCKLTYFEARDIYNLTARCIENFELLLEKQINYLEEIDLGDWIAVDIVKMIFHMPRLKKLTFKGFHNVEEHVRMNEIDFHRSQSITTLNLIDTFSKPAILQAFIQACPNVTRLKLYSLKKESLSYLTQALPNLQVLSVDLLEIKEFNNECDFVYLKEFKMKVYHRGLQFSEALNNNFENLVKKEVESLENMNKVTFVN
ncbi:unnamed protein product [Chironomus riparius]|uniref:F-box domain-containing protein n=1 Tax=Chironomus riparius TaxID=315576 RepID=A0A9N9RR85_9DIPT|nr:unnamed protein product [Chironomus riparius]